MLNSCKIAYIGFEITAIHIKSIFLGNIFDEQKLYPHQGTIKGHSEDHYDSVFIALLPFFQLDREETDKSNLKKAKILSHEEALKEIDLIKKLPEANREIYSYDNDRYIFG